LKTTVRPTQTWHTLWHECAKYSTVFGHPGIAAIIHAHEDDQPGSEDVISKINLLVDKLKITTDGGERRALLREFRGLLESADAMTVDDDALHV